MVVSVMGTTLGGITNLFDANNNRCQFAVTKQLGHKRRAKPFRVEVLTAVAGVHYYTVCNLIRKSQLNDLSFVEFGCFHVNSKGQEPGL